MTQAQKSYPQRQLLEKWPKIQQQLATPKAFELLIPESLTNAIAQKLAEGKLDYTAIIKGIRRLELEDILVDKPFNTAKVSYITEQEIEEDKPPKDKLHTPVLKVV